jgi:diguanylate cyclase (GGDEF)-like protein
VVTIGGTALVILRACWVREERAAWAVVAAALVLLTCGNLYISVFFAGQDVWPAPSPGDGLSLGGYAVAYAGLVLLLRGRARGVPASLWLDGLVGSLAIAGVVATFVFQPLLDATHGSIAFTITNLAYPIADAAMLGLVVGSFALTGWRPGRAWGLLGAAYATAAVGDAIYVVETIGRSAHQPSGLVNLIWTLPFGLAAVAAWQHRGRRPARFDSWPVLVLPVVATAAALALLVYGNLAGMGDFALALAGGAVVVGIVRTVLTLAEVRSLSDVSRLALTDDLTGLPGRRAFQTALDDASAKAVEQGTELTLMVIDLVGFKDLNDTLGHIAGDEVLAQVAARLRHAVRVDDFLGRLGSDEFGLLMPGIGDDEGAIQTADRVRDAVGRELKLAEMTLRIDATAGVAVLGRHGANGADLLQRAHVAVGQAKSDESSCRIYDPARDPYSRDRLELSSQLRAAIAGRQLAVHFQPKADMVTGDVIGVEALARWQHPERGLIPPGEFIPLAEQAGLMGPLTAAILEQTLAEVAGWTEAHSDLTVAVNVAAANVLDTSFPAVVSEALEKFGIEPGRLVLELTENTVMTDAERGRAALDELHAIGLKLALDDFGTGYSSLSWLASLPVDELKIDRSFVIELLTSHGNEVIVHTVIDLARNLGLRVVAEGIEDEETYERLRDHGCDIAQGYHLARPMPAADLLPWLSDHARRGLTGEQVDPMLVQWPDRHPS